MLLQKVIKIIRIEQSLSMERILKRKLEEIGLQLSFETGTPLSKQIN
jgi:hypothetical protein